MGRTVEIISSNSVHSLISETLNYINVDIFVTSTENTWHIY